MHPLLETDRLTKRFGPFTAVDSITMTADAGEIVALLGPNGAGKTTTLRMLMGILEPSGGAARIDGLDCFRRRAEVMHVVGYLPDDPPFYDYLRGSEIIRFVGEMHGLDARQIADRATPLAERFELEDDLGEFAANYSKGMKKKLALICALLHKPRLLILDEPASGLDPHGTRALHELVRAESRAGACVLFSTHLLDQAERLCHRVGILYRGRLAALAPLADLRRLHAGAGSLEDVYFHVTAAGDGGAPEAEERDE